MKRPLANYHTHSTWCDGANTPEEVVLAAIEKGFAEIGFSSHAMLPQDDVDWVLTPAKALAYAKEVRSLAAKYAPKIKVLCGVEADYVPGGAVPDRSTYATISPDYIIGSIHFTVAEDGTPVPVDHTIELLVEGIRDHFGGDSRAFIQAYFRQEREMAKQFDFDVIGHPDICRKFNGRLAYFDENADWYLAELEHTADVFAASGKLVELNTGAIARGWMDDVYPSVHFRQLLRERGVKFILSSDAHAANTIDCAFDRFWDAEEFVSPKGNT